jgi:serine palmitoyltransferase
MQDRLTDGEIEDLLKEWKERGRLTLTGVPIDEWESKKNDIDGSSAGSSTTSANASGGSGKNSNNAKRRMKKIDENKSTSDNNATGSNQILKSVVIEAMYGSKIVLKVDLPASASSTTSTSTNNHTSLWKKESSTNISTAVASTKKTLTVLNFATFDFLGMSCPDTSSTTSTTNATTNVNVNATPLMPLKNNDANTSNDKNNNGNDKENSSDTLTKYENVDVVKDAAVKALSKYGCGSCGPRGFYGTIDAHLDFENAMVSFLQTDGAILYSDGAAASTSTVAAFAKRGDLLVVDEGVYESLGTGVTLSRANVKYFKHNDMEDLRRVLERIQETDEALNRKKNDQRKFIVVEALYKNYGTVCPLDELIKLKEEFCYRLILDESFSFGSLGQTGKGALEHYNLEHMRHAEIVTFSLENSMGSIGGITVGNEEVVDHQRLSGAGYCFSASLPPFLATAAQASLKKMETEPQLLSILRENVTYFYQQLNTEMSSLIPSKVMVTSEEGLSPIVYLQFTKQEDHILSREEQIDLFDAVAANCLQNGVFVVSTGSHVFNHLHKIPSPGIRMTIMAKQSKNDIDTAIKILKNAISTIV